MNETNPELLPAVTETAQADPAAAAAETVASDKPRVGIPHDFVAEMSGIHPDQLQLRAGPLPKEPEVDLNTDHFITKQP